MWRATIKSLLARKLRLLLTAIAVVLGVGFMAGTLVLTDTATKSFDGLFGDVYGGVDVVVQGTSAFSGGPQGPGGGGEEERNPVPASVLSNVAAIPGVATVDGDVSGFAQFIDPSTDKVIQNGGAPTIGNSWDPHATTLEVREGAPPSGPSEVAVDAGTAKEHDLSVGTKIQVVTQTGVGGYSISGIVGIGGQDSLLGATLAVFDLPTAQRLFDREGAYDHLFIVAADGVPASGLRDRISRQIPDGFEAVTGDTAAAQQAQEVQDALGFLRTGLLVFAFISVFVGAFIIFNTFNIIVTQRTRELGLLRALGASRRQILGSVLAEAFLTGLAASVAGLGAGLLLALALRKLLDAIGLDLPATGQQIAGRTIALSLAVGTLVTVAASISPARRASRVSPIEALRESAAPSASLRRRVIVGTILTALGAALIAGGLFADVPNPALVVGVGAYAAFIGAAILSPLVARPLAIGFGRLFGGVSGKLGTENAKRNPRRTASTAAALMVGLALVTMVTVLSASLKASASAALDENLRSDFILSSTNFSPFSPTVAERLADDEAFAAVSPFRQGQVRVDGKVDFASGIDPATIEQAVNVPLASGTLAALNEPNTILVFQGVARTRELDIGDTIDVTFARTGRHELTVGGIFSDNSLLGNFAISLASYERNFAQQLDSVVFVKVAEATSLDEARRRIEAVLDDFPNIEVRNQVEFKQEQSRQIDRVLVFVIALLLLSILIALFGIVNTLGLSIYERVRELGLLRAVGMGRGQVRAMVRVEAVIIALIGATLGLGIGLVFGWALQRALSSLGVKELAIPVGRLVVYLAVTAVAGVVASLWPARRAANLDILQAISYE